MGRSLYLGLPFGHRRTQEHNGKDGKCESDGDTDTNMARIGPMVACDSPGNNSGDDSGNDLRKMFESFQNFAKSRNIDDL